MLDTSQISMLTTMEDIGMAGDYGMGHVISGNIYGSKQPLQAKPAMRNKKIQTM